MSRKIFVKQAKLVKSLAHPSRLEIIHLLRSHSLTVGQITKMLGARQAYTSQHLLVLKHAQVVRAHRDGKEIYYQVADPRLLKACDALHSLTSLTPLAMAPEPVVVDPVCGMHLTPNKSSYQEEYNGVRHYFCGRGCQKEFHVSH